MRRPERSITSFRRRLLRLINEKFEGRYTYLAQRAGIPISSLEHTIHEAQRLPGGEHLLRMAAALDEVDDELFRYVRRAKDRGMIVSVSGTGKKRMVRVQFDGGDVGMNVIGIRHSGRHAGDHADEVAVVDEGQAEAHRRDVDGNLLPLDQSRGC